MYLKHFQLISEDDKRDSTYHSHFAYHTYVIRYCLSKQLRKIKFETDGTFDTINIIVGAVKPPYVEIPWYKALNIYIPFNLDLYDNSDEEERCRYYVDWVRKGLKIAYDNKNIPYEELLEWLDSLADNDFIYSWPFKDITDREHNLKIRFVCYLTMYDFTIKMAAFDKKRSVCICEGQVVRTKPDSIFFSLLSSKKVKLNDGKIIFPDRFDNELIYIEIKDILAGNLIVRNSPNPYPDDARGTEIFYNFQKTLKYDNNVFI